MVLLCRRHHRLVHEGGVSVRLLDDGAIVFHDAQGRRIEAAPRLRGDADAVVEHNRAARVEIEPDTATGLWRGERLDLGLAIECLCAQQAAAPAVQQTG